MKVGLFINTQFPEGVNVADRIPEIVQQVRAARDAGFKSLWFPHHWLTYPMQMLQITPVMAYVAAHAQGMTIGPKLRHNLLQHIKSLERARRGVDRRKRQR